MAEYTNIPDSSLEPGKPIRSVDIIALRDNIEHYAENNGTTQVFTSPGTWTKPATVKRVKVTVIGGGGGCASTGPFPIPSSGSQVGNPGGTSSFGGFLSATGGVGSPSGGSAGGSGSGGDLDVGGQRGLNMTDSDSGFSTYRFLGGSAAFGLSGSAFATAPSSVPGPSQTFRIAGANYGGGAVAIGPARRSAAGAGGGSIEYIPAPSIPGPVSVTVGAGGTAGGPAAPTGATGAAGVIIVEEFY
jgi:hypothetical protein